MSAIDCIEKLMAAIFGPPTLHTHSCCCGQVWEHMEGGDHEHTCPACGEAQFRKSWDESLDPPEDKPEVTVSILPLLKNYKESPHEDLARYPRVAPNPLLGPAGPQ
jgi:hypothetical protein